MKERPIAVACHKDGISALPIFYVNATDYEVAVGMHYGKAEAMAEQRGYEKPFICYDSTTQGVIVSAARALDLVTQVVAIDLSDSEIRSIRCDAGRVKVVCFGEIGIEEGATYLPVGVGGKLVLCKADVQVATVDWGLKEARHIAEGRSEIR